MQEEYLFNVAIVGESSVGKSSLLLQYVHGKFDPAIKTTINASMCDKHLNRDNCLVTLKVVDTSGQKRYRSLMKVYYQRALGLIVVFDLTNQSSLESVPCFIEETSPYVDQDCLKILVGSKADLTNEREIDKAEAQAMADRYGMQYIETSAKEALNINIVFDTLANQLIQYKRTICEVDNIRLESVKNMTVSEANSADTCCRPRCC